MALPDYIDIAQGTAIDLSFVNSSSVNVFDGMTGGTAIQSAKADLGANYAMEYAVVFRVRTGATAPAAGTTLELYLLTSHNGTDWPAKIAGATTAATYTLGTSDANLKLAGPATASLVVTADADTTLETAYALWRPRGRYVVGIVDSNLSVALGSGGLSKVLLIPLRTTVLES